MKRVMVRYRVKPAHVEENEGLVRAVYDELHRTSPAGLQYATFKLDDGMSFVHLAVTEKTDGDSPLSKLASFQEFQAGISERVDEAPVAVELHKIGSYRLLD